LCRVLKAWEEWLKQRCRMSRPSATWRDQSVRHEVKSFNLGRCLGAKKRSF
jgi:hypothetical protein